MMKKQDHFHLAKFSNDNNKFQKNKIQRDIVWKFEKSRRRNSKFFLQIAFKRICPGNFTIIFTESTVYLCRLILLECKIQTYQWYHMDIILGCNHLEKINPGSICVINFFAWEIGLSHPGLRSLITSGKLRGLFSGWEK